MRQSYDVHSPSFCDDDLVGECRHLRHDVGGIECGKMSFPFSNSKD